MSNIVIHIPGELTDLNTYIRAERSNRYFAAKLKKEETERVAWLSKGHKVEKYPINIACNWYLKDKKKDPDNVSFSIKFILDGLVMAGVLENDSQKYIKSIGHNFFIDKKNPRVEVEILDK